MNINKIAILSGPGHVTFTEGHLNAIKKACPQIQVVLAYSVEELVLKAHDTDALVIWPFFKSDFEEFCRKAPNLKWIHAFTTGVDGILKSDISNLDIRITSTKGIHGAPIADHVLSFIFAFIRDLLFLRECQSRKEWYRNRMDLACDESFNKTVGIIGLGNIGMVIAEKCKKLGMRVVGLKRNPVESEWVDICYSNDGLEKLLKESDFVVIAAPLTPETTGMIGERELRLMKKSAVLINIARGGLVDEPALIKALQEKTIGGAGLDVTDPEPLSQDSPLWEMPNVIITPHIAAHSPYYMDRAVEIIIENINRFMNNQDLLYEVDKKRGY